MAQRITKAAIINNVTCSHVEFCSKAEEKRYRDCCNLVCKMLVIRAGRTLGKKNSSGPA